MTEVSTVGIERPAGASRPLRARVLVVDDDPLLRKVLARVLQAQGYVVAVVSDGVEAVVAHASGSFDVILMDCQMPRLDGFEATRAIRRVEAERGGRTPIVALTAMQAARAQCLDAGMDDYVMKPIHPPDLDALIKRSILTQR